MVQLLLDVHFVCGLFADLTVSGDRKHLLPLGTHAGIAIIDAAEALRRIEPIQA